jgi:protein-S-isoprenylcysteine O-methyltransferase Ste14
MLESVKQVVAEVVASATEVAKQATTKKAFWIGVAVVLAVVFLGTCAVPAEANQNTFDTDVHKLNYTNTIETINGDEYGCACDHCDCDSVRNQSIY